MDMHKSSHMGDGGMGGEMDGMKGMGHSGMPAMNLEPGIKSPSGKYSCLMCKKFFELAEPVCPYMPKMCVNTPLAVESVAPGSTMAFERIGLYYPKLLQRALAGVMPKVTDEAALGRRLAEEYLAELADWRVQYKDNPLEAVKSFVIYFAGADAATRNTESGITFYLMDATQFWGKEMPEKKRVKMTLLAGINRLKQEFGLKQNFDLHFMDMTPEPAGRFYCPMCNMFFEFGTQAPTVTCPFMPQKCKFKPHEIREEAGTDLNLLIKIYKVSPKLYRRFADAVLAAAGQGQFDRAELRAVVESDLARWGFELDQDKVGKLLDQMGIA